MYKISDKATRRSGFTLLEVILTITIIVVLVVLALGVINPIRQSSQTRDLQRQGDVADIYRAVRQYYSEKGSYPVKLADESKVYGICASKASYQAETNCGDLVSIISLVNGSPTYMPDIPMDPTAGALGADTFYRIAINKITGVYVEAPKTEMPQGTDRTIAYAGVPPEGYDIPTIQAFDVSSSSVNKFVGNIEENVSGWPSWIIPVLIFAAGVVTGYVLSTWVEKSETAKTPEESL